MKVSRENIDHRPSYEGTQVMARCIVFILHYELSTHLNIISVS